MKQESRLTLSVIGVLLFLALIAGFWSPAATTTYAAITDPQASGQTQSVTGKITAVDKSSFTLAIAGAMTSPGHQLSAADGKSMTFLVDKNTTVDGKLQVGANADVTYREEGGKNIAINVRIVPAA